MNKFFEWWNKNELWLEFGYIYDKNFEDMLWYNEGRASELGYFLKHLFKNKLRKDMYFKMRFARMTFYLKGAKPC